jgi:HEPN domain-containing protein
VRNAGYAVKDGDTKLAAFLFHQATERFYHCLILVRTLYSPRTHSLNRLRKLAEELEPRLVEVWRGTPSSSGGPTSCCATLM